MCDFGLMKEKKCLRSDRAKRPCISLRTKFWEKNKMRKHLFENLYIYVVA